LYAESEGVGIDEGSFEEVMSDGHGFVAQEENIAGGLNDGIKFVGLSVGIKADLLEEYGQPDLFKRFYGLGSFFEPVFQKKLW
jgi:hypothetical protein